MNPVFSKWFLTVTAWALFNLPLLRAAESNAASESRFLASVRQLTYEGRRSDEIHRERPEWSLFRDGCPHGEGAAEVGARADRLVQRLRATSGKTLIFSSGHLLRVLTARWLGLDPAAGACVALFTASLSVLGYEHGDRDPVILLWNQQQRTA